MEAARSLPLLLHPPSPGVTSLNASQLICRDPFGLTSFGPKVVVVVLGAEGPGSLDTVERSACVFLSRCTSWTHSLLNHHDLAYRVMPKYRCK